MELLSELPVEALLFRYSATIAGYFWTCLALFAAGVGVWRFQFFGSASRSASASSLNSPTPAVSPVIPAPSPAPTQIAPSSVEKEHCGDREEGGSLTKGRFTAYYIVEEEIGGQEIDGEEMGDECPGGTSSLSGGVHCFDFDLFRWQRKGDLGWYRNQDRMAINGSVVRLWDDCWRGLVAAQPPTYGFSLGGLGVW